MRSGTSLNFGQYNVSPQQQMICPTNPAFQAQQMHSFGNVSLTSVEPLQLKTSQFLQVPPYSSYVPQQFSTQASTSHSSQQYQMTPFYHLQQLPPPQNASVLEFPQTAEHAHIESNTSSNEDEEQEVDDEQMVEGEDEEEVVDDEQMREGEDEEEQQTIEGETSD